MDKLYELRVYVTHPDMYQVLHDQWESDHFAIYSDFHAVLGSFDALNRDGDTAGVGDELGIAVFMEHEDRAAVDRSMADLIKSNRMNEIGGPPGHTIVHHWERTFLYPLAIEPDRPAGPSSGGGVYELRQFMADDDELQGVADLWSSVIYEAYRATYEVRGLFVAHPESSEMPTGVAVLLRHDDLAAANRIAGAAIVDEVRSLAGDQAIAITGCARQLLRPMSISPMT